ncbi:hypothetical protein [Nocardioides alcanivorans]|uniref:hypothetical protein n=1 Tax=Nocardioides alcanivorans TaxID=2897352 RepID=UPI001F306DD7|nr:hypothetical protein [Nocardioides alcanivorans]
MRVDDRSGVVAVVVTVVTLVLCFGTVAWVALSEHDDLPRADAGVSRSASRDVSRSATEPAALRVYRAWQRRREAAWALGDPRSSGRCTSTLGPPAPTSGCCAPGWGAV